jgi:hypothetical protein
MAPVVPHRWAAAVAVVAMTGGGVSLTLMLLKVLKFETVLKHYPI